MGLFPVTNKRFTNELHRELALRSTLAASGQLLALATLLVLPRFRNQMSAELLSQLLLLATAIGARFWLRSSFNRVYRDDPTRWLAIFWVSIICGAAAWGWLASLFFLNHGDAASLVVSVLMQAGITAAATTSLGPMPGATTAFCAIMLGVPYVCLWQSGRFDMQSAPTLFYGAYFVFLISIARAQRRELVKRIRFAAQLEDQRDQLQTVLSATPGLVCCVDQELRLRFANGEYRELFGEGSGGREQNEEFFTVVHEFLEGTDPVGTAQATIHANGRDQAYFVTMRRSWSPRGAVVVAMNMQALHEANRKLEQTAKMVLVGEMAGGIAHEINNPLTVIQGHTSRIRASVARGTLDPGAIAAAVAKIELMVTRITRIVKGLKLLSRDDSNDAWQVYALPTMVEETLDLARERLLDAAIELRLGEIPKIELHGASVQISQVLLNIISNARDAVEGLPEKWIRVEFEASQDNLLIRIADSGKGIPPEVREKMLDPFFTTKAPGKGTGLGLSISRSLLERHGGKLWINESSVNTEFVIELPRMQREKCAA